MGAQILKAVLTQALLFVSKDQFEQYALLILTILRRLSVSYNVSTLVNLFK